MTPRKPKRRKFSQAKYDKARRELDAKYAPRLKALRDSERLTGDDFAIRINATLD